MRVAGRLALVVCALGSAACRSPTQIAVTVTTDVPCARVASTSFTAGRLVEVESVPPSSTSTVCEGGRLGAVVLVPSGDDSAQVGFKVITALDGQNVEACGAGGTYGPECIVARRALRYIPHTPLTVDVDMRLACAGIGCSDPTLTCVRGECVPATIPDPSQCSGSGCSEGVLVGGDAGAPAGDAGFDATVGEGGGPDAAVADAHTDAGIVEAGADGVAPPPADAGTGAAVPQCDLGGVQAGAAWPMEGYCPTRRNRTPFVATKSATAVKGPFALDGAIVSAPSIGADGTLFAGTDAHTIQAFHPDGFLLWRYTSDAGASFQSMPLLAVDGTVRVFDYSGASDYVVLDAKSGAEFLRVPGLVQVRGGPALVSGGTTYAPDNNTARLFALSPEGGARWSAPGGTDLINPAVASDGTIVIADSSGNMSAIYPDGGVRWSASIAPSSALHGLSIAVDSTIRVSSDDTNTIYAVDLASHAVVWSVPFPGLPPGEVHGFSLGDDGTMYVGTASHGIMTVDKSGTKGATTYGLNCNPPTIDGAGNLLAWCDETIASIAPDLSKNWSVNVPTADIGVPVVIDTPLVAPSGAVYIAVSTSSFVDGGPGSIYGIYVIGP